MRRIATGASFACLLGLLGGADGLAAVQKATWKANATPAWSRTLTGFQASFFRHKRSLGIETPDWISLVCADTSGSKTAVGRFGAHFESKGHPIAARYGIGKSKSLKGTYDTARDVSVVRVPPALPPPSRVRAAFNLTPRQGSVAGKVTFTVSWADPAAPYKDCSGTFRIQPR
jgi:hypothetical protein